MVDQQSTGSEPDGATRAATSGTSSAGGTGSAGSAPGTGAAPQRPQRPQRPERPRRRLPRGWRGVEDVDAATGRAREQRAGGERESRSTLVVGLGRFGQAIATSLDRLGQEVLVAEKDPDIVAQWSGRLPVVEADLTNPEALEQLGVRDFPVVVVAVGTSLESSVLITGNLVDIGTPQIWAKAVSAEHGRILQRIGAHHVVFPEADAGNRVAHLVSGKLLDYIEVEDGFTIVKMRPPRELHGFTLAQSGVRSRYGVTVIGVKSPGVEFRYATPDTRVSPNDILIVSGPAELLERFAARP